MIIATASVDAYPVATNRKFARLFYRAQSDISPWESYLNQIADVDLTRTLVALVGNLAAPKMDIIGRCVGYPRGWFDCAFRRVAGTAQYEPNPAQGAIPDDPKSLRA